MAELNRIKKLRKERSLTLDDLSEKINVPRATLNRYENGTSTPKMATWEKLATFFNVSVAYIMGLSDERTEDTRMILNEIKNTLSENYSQDDLSHNYCLAEINKSLDNLKEQISTLKSKMEKEYIEAFTKLNDAGREELFKYADYLYSQEKYRTEKIEMFINGKKVSPTKSDVSKK